MRIIAHLDMDAFFASLEEAGSRIFKGKPIVVGADPKGGKGRGVVSTANYKAREYGIKSALPISRAWQLSQKAKSEGKEEAIFLQPDFERYVKASRQVYEIIKKYASQVEPASIDEFYFDLSFVKNFKKSEKICFEIKREIKEKLGVTCSVGLGPNKLIAKIAAGQNKPDGFLKVEDADKEKFLEPMGIREIPGIGPKAELKLNTFGIKTVKDLKKVSKEKLEELFGKWGGDMYLKARGIDDSPIVENREVKSIGEQMTFEKDTLDFREIGEVFEKMQESVFKRFKESGFKSFETVGVTVRFSGFETKTSAKTLEKPTADLKKLKIETLKLLLPYLDARKNPKKKLIRLVGVKLEKFL